jgi:hypothetical protein
VFFEFGEMPLDETVVDGLVSACFDQLDWRPDFDTPDDSCKTSDGHRFAWVEQDEMSDYDSSALIRKESEYLTLLIVVFLHLHFPVETDKRQGPVVSFGRPDVRDQPVV